MGQSRTANRSHGRMNASGRKNKKSGKQTRIMNSPINFFGKMSMGVLGLLAVALLCPIGGSSASADSDTQATIDALITVQPMISLGVQQAVEIDLTPTSQGIFGTNSAKMTVSTNSKEGYKVLISADGDNSLKSVDDSNTRTIAALTGAVSEADFKKQNNTWGYSISPEGSTATTYQGVTTNATEMNVGATADLYQQTYDLTFGTQIGADLPAGSYTGSVLVSAVANPVTITSLEQLSYMQDMSPTICDNTAVHQTKRLIDTRDGKAYWVAKLKDGNCWMTQNLDYDMVAGKVLTPSDTNVSANYTIKTTTETKVPAVIDVSANNNAAYYTERSWNMGDYVLATPLKGITCNNPNVSTESPNTDAYNSLRYGDTFDRCSDFQNVAGWLPTYQAQTGNWKGAQAGNGGEAAAEGLVAADAATKTYDAHYLIGNYYQYNAATLGSAPASVNTKIDTTRSICPKGWKLPTSGNTGSGSGTNTTTTAFVNKDDSFYNLLAEYGYANSKGYNWNNGNPYTSIIKGTSADNYLNNTAASPLYYVRGGGVYPGTGSLRHTGYAGLYWSATIYPNATNAHFLDFVSTDVYPSYYNVRFNGFAVRCVAQ